MPSARVAEVSAAEDVDADVYSARKTTPARLRKRLGGDLDRIVLKALHKDPAQRYSSAAELAADIENVLFDRPIMARRDSVVYRTSKFVRRHALAVVTGVITVIAVIAGSATFTYRLSQEKQTAETEATKAREVSTFLIDLVKLSEPERSQGRAVTVREVLDRAAGRIDVELAGQPQLQATLQNVIGQMYRELGEFARAEALLDQALETMAATGGRNRQGITDIHAQRSELFLYQSRYDEALAAIDNALDLLNQEPAPPADVLPDLLRIRGGALRLLGRHDEARVSLMEAQAALQRNPAPDSRLGAAIFLELGNVDHDASDFDSARQNFGEAINRLSGDGQPPTLDLSRAHMRIAWVFVELNQLAAAEEHARTALDIASSIHGSNHPDVLFPLGVLSSVQADRGEFDAAERSLDTQLQIARETLGSEHADTATIMNNMGTMKFRQGRYEDAAAWYRQAVAVRRTALGPEHPITGMTMSFEAYARYLSGDPSAENLYRDALAVLEAAYEPGHRYIANVHHDLGRIYVDRGQYEEAEPLLRSALEARQAIYGEDNVRVAATKLYLGACLSGRGELAEAGVLIEESRAWTVTAHGEGSDEVAHADLWKSDWLRRSGRDDEADRLLEEASSLIRAEKPADHWLRRIASRLEAQT
jgi:serine/threonine-protein kinase